MHGDDSAELMLDNPYFHVRSIIFGVN